MALQGEKLGVGVETFVHGALCVSYSGQCLISAFMENRSGNRGLCAQLCRRPYQKEVNGKWRKKRLYLSMRDLSALPLLPQLVKAQVRSLKIEGRLKRPEYVAGVVSVYREALDRIGEGDSGPFPDLELRLRLVYNRGFICGGLDGSFSSENTTGAWGGPKFLKVGDLLRVDRLRARLLVRLEEKPEPGDGLALFAESGGAPIPFVTTKVFEQNNEELWIGVKPFDGDMGDCPEKGILYITSSAKELERIRSTIQAYRPKKIPLRLDVSGALGSPLKVNASTDDGTDLTCASKIHLIEAGKRPLDSNILCEQLGRLGQTPYFLENLDWRGAGNLFLPISELNAIRRSLVEKLELWRSPHRTLPKVDPAEFTKSSDMIGTQATAFSAICYMKDIAKALEAGAKRIYCPALDLIRGAPPATLKVWIWIPSITPFDLFEEISTWVADHRNNIEGVLVGHLGAADLAIKNDLPYWADSSLNVFNQLSCEWMKENGAIGATLSWEVQVDDAVNIASNSGLPLEIPVFGRAPLMETGLKNLAPESGSAFLHDDRGIRYPLRGWQGNTGFTVESPFFRIGLRNLYRFYQKAALLRLDFRETPSSYFDTALRLCNGALENPDICEDDIEAFRKAVHVETALEKGWS